MSQKPFNALDDQDSDDEFDDVLRRVMSDPDLRSRIDNAYHQAIAEFLKADPDALIHELLPAFLPDVVKNLRLTSEQLQTLVLAAKVGANTNQSSPKIELHEVFFLLAEDPAKATYWIKKGNYCMSISYYANAIRCFDKALRIDPNAIEAQHNRDESRKRFR